MGFNEITAVGFNVSPNSLGNWVGLSDIIFDGLGVDLRTVGIDVEEEVGFDVGVKVGFKVGFEVG